MYSAVEHIARVIWSSRYSKKNLMAVLLQSQAGYFDASGKPEGGVLCVAGAVAPVNAWIKFAKDWSKVLAREHVNEFHATDFAASRGEYKGWKNDKPRRSRFLHDLGVVLRNSASRLFMVNVEMDAWHLVNQEYQLKEHLYHPYALAGYSNVELVEAWRKHRRIVAPIEYAFEDGDRGYDGLKKLCAERGIIPIRLPKKKAVMFQAADMIGWKSRILSVQASKHEVHATAGLPAALAGMRNLLEDWKSLEKVLVLPGEPGFYGVESLRRTCQKRSIPKR